MIRKTPELIFNLIFNGLFAFIMTVAIGIYQQDISLGSVLHSWVCAFCAAMTLSCILNIPEIGGKAAKCCHCNSPFAGYLVSNVCAGIVMGILMNLVVTFMMIGLVPFFPMAYMSTLGLVLAVSVVGSCILIAPIGALVGRICK